jgi:hypothetical protein
MLKSNHPVQGLAEISQRVHDLAAISMQGEAQAHKFAKKRGSGASLRNLVELLLL